MVMMDIGRLIHSATAGLGQLPTPPPDAPSDDNAAKETDWKTPEAMPLCLHSAPESPRTKSANSPAISPTAYYATAGMADGGESPPPDSKLTVGDFHLLKILGTGTFSKVWLVIPRGSEEMPEPRLYALKQLRKADVIRLKQVEHIRNEKSILELCRNHPFITSYLNAWQDRGSLYLLLEYSPGGEMFGYLRRARRFDYAVARFYAAEITLILVFLHDHGVVYRDLKPENILLDARGHIKLVDFGFAKVIGDRETYTLCGTPEYLSPEVIQSKGHTKAVDWWALGILIYEMILGYPPFYDNSPIQIYKKIVAESVAFPAWVSPDARDIVQRLCTKDLSARLGNTKGGGHEVMRHPFFRGIDWRELESQKHEGPVVPELRFLGDTRYFENYDPSGPSPDDEYPESMYREYDHVFRDF